MRVVRTAMLLAAALLLVAALRLTSALPANPADQADQRDPEHEQPQPEQPGHHFPRPSEIIHAVGSYVHGAHQQHVQDHHEEHHEQHQQHHEHHRPTHRPPHHHNQPEKIIATKTVFVEVTKRVTRHPVCMTAYGVKPPCLPIIPYGPPKDKPCAHGVRSADGEVDEDDDIFNEADLKEGLYISPSAVAELPTASEAYEVPEDLDASARSARYLELRAPAPPAQPASPTPALPAVPAVEASEADTQVGRQHSQHHGAGAGGLLHHHNKETIFETKTLWVTKVEKYTDYRVTATLVAENCIPTDSKIPFCGATGHGPSYEGGDEYVVKPVHKPVHKPIHPEPVHKPAHHDRPPHHEPVHRPPHHVPAHPPHHEPTHKPPHHEPAHPPHHEPTHRPPHHVPAHPPHHEPAHKPVHQEVVYEKPPHSTIEYSEGPDNHHWKEGEEAPAAVAAVAPEAAVAPAEEAAAAVAEDVSPNEA